MCKFQGHMDLKCRKSWPGDSHWQLPTILGVVKDAQREQGNRHPIKTLQDITWGMGVWSPGGKDLFILIFPLKLLPGISAALTGP